MGEISRLRALSAFLAIAAMLAAVAAATAQEALGPARTDLAAIERELHGILDYSAPDDVIRFDLPSGARASIRTDLPVDRRGGGQCIGCREPCRGYEVTYRTPGGTRETVLQGFRCRQERTGLWVMRRPEQIVATRTLTPTDGPDTAETVTGTLADRLEGDPRVSGSPDESAGADPVDAPAVADAVTGKAEAPVAGATSLAAADQADPAAPAETEPPVIERQAARVIYPAPAGAAESPGGDTGPGLAADPAVVEALRTLRYLPSGADGPANPEDVDAAIDAFAADERMALPVDDAVMVMRLESAVERNESLPNCGEASAADEPAGPCLEAR